jgi:hypothetical protein
MDFPTIYFPDFKQLEVLFYYDGPKQILAERNGVKHVLLHLEQDEEKQIWLAIELNEDEYKKYCVEDSVTLREVMDDKSEFTKMVLENNGFTTYSKIKYDDLDERYFPK